MNRVLLLLYVFMVFVGCDNPDVRKTSELEGFRVLGLRTTPHVIELNASFDVLTVEVIAFAEQEATAYEWTLCASLGALDRFECIPDTPTLTGQSTSAQWSIPFNTSVFGALETSEVQATLDAWVPPVCPDYELIACDAQRTCPSGALCVGETCRSPTELYPIQFIVRVQPILGTEEGIPAALSIPIRAGTSNNTQIQALGLTVDDTEMVPMRNGDCTTLVLSHRSAKPIAIALSVDASSLDSFTTARDDMCIEGSELETGTVSWFAQGATLQKSISSLDDPTNEMEIESESKSITLYGILRDGRGSLDYVCAHGELE